MWEGVFCMSDAIFRERFETLKFTELFEMDDERRIDIQRQIQILEDNYRTRNQLDFDYTTIESTTHSIEEQIIKEGE